MGDAERDMKNDFPVLRDSAITYLDSAATSQCPESVILAETKFNSSGRSNTGRSVYPLAMKATENYEKARETIARFLGAVSSKCIVFTSGTTMGINLVAHAWARRNLRVGRNTVLVTFSDHHANIVPWQILAEEGNCKFEMVKVSDKGVLNLNSLKKRLKEGDVGLVCIGHVSNVTAAINPVERIAELVHYYNAALLVDGAQAVGHIPVNVRQLGVDFYVFSGHKMLGPMGTGVLYVSRRRHNEIGVMFGGGDMISRVEPDKSWFKPMPTRLEAGTQNVAGALGLAEAISWIENYQYGIRGVERRVKELGSYAWKKLRKIPHIRLLGPGPGAKCSSSLVSFTFDHDGAPNTKRIKNDLLAKYLGERGICVRSGIFCAQPLMEHIFGLNGAVRASFHVYNDEKDVDALVEAIYKIIESGAGVVETGDLAADGIAEFMRVQVIADNELGTVVGVKKGCSCRDGWCKVYLDKGSAEEFRFGRKGDINDLRVVVSEPSVPVTFVNTENVDAVIRDGKKVKVCPGTSYYSSRKGDWIGVVARRAPSWESLVIVQFENGSEDKFYISSPQLIIVD